MKKNQAPGIVWLLILLTNLFQSLPAQECTKSKPLPMPADTLANPLTVTLFQNLVKYARQGIMVGHQDALSYGVNWKGNGERSDIKDITGAHPAVYGWEIGGLEMGRNANLDGVPFDEMRQNIIRAYENGGINTISWHAFNPVTGKDSWANTKRPNPTVRKMLPGGPAHQAFRQQLDLVAAFFLSLKGPQGEAIPLVFRPWHEHSGNWFWWGKMHCSREEYIELYRFTIDYLQQQHQIHQLLIAFSPDVGFTDEASYLERYPGDDIVDVMGVDDYHSLRTNQPQQLILHLEIISELAAKKNKVAAFTETGVTDLAERKYFMEELYPCLNHSDKTRSVAWVLFWRNHDEQQHYVPYQGHPSTEDFVRFTSQDIIWLNNELPDFYGRLKMSEKR